MSHIRDEILAELAHCHAVGYSVSDTATRVANLAAQMQRDALEEQREGIAEKCSDLAQEQVVADAWSAARDCAEIARGYREKA